MEKEIVFQGVMYRATTTVDGGWRVSFDVAQNDVESIQLLTRHREQLLQIACVPVPRIGKYDSNDAFRPEGQ